MLAIIINQPLTSLSSTEETSSISWNLVKQWWSSEVSLIIEYISKVQISNTELIDTLISLNTFNDLSNYVPSNINNAFIKQRTLMTPNFALNLDKILNEKVVTIIGVAQVGMY